MNRRLLSLSSLAIAAVLLLTVNILGGALFKSSRVDLTAERLFTLTDGSKEILAGLADRITLNFYFSDRLLRDVPQLKSYAVRVEELLNEYVNRRPDKIKLNIVDPEPLSDAEDRAVQFGIKGVPANESGELAYFGLAGVNTTDGEQVIPFFHPSNEDTLEYEVTRLLYNLDNPKKKVIAIIGSLPLDGILPNMQPGRGAQPATVMTQIDELFETRMLRDREIPRIDKDVDVLLLAHPRELSDTTLFAIDQFVLRGGRVIAFIDPFADAEPATADPFMPNMPNPKAPSDLGPLLAAWGVRIDPERIVADAAVARKVAVSADPQAAPIDYLLWMEVPRSHLNTDDVIASKLTTLSLATTGSIKPIEGATTTLTPLIESSEQAMEYPVVDIQTRPDPKAILDAFKPTGKKFLLAARLSGPVKTAFPQGAPTGEKASAETGEILTQSRGSVNMILFADSDILADRFWVQVEDYYGERVAYPFADNGSLVINALDNLSGSNALISVRSRASYARPFKLVRNIQREAETRFRAKEQELQGKLEETDKRLRELQQNELHSLSEQQAGRHSPDEQKPANEADSALLTPEQQQEIERFVAEKVRIRKELRAVQRDMRKDIEVLQNRLRLGNIALVPALIGVSALLFGLARLRRRRPVPV